MSKELQFNDDEPELINPYDLDKVTSSKPVDEEEEEPTWINVAEGIWENTRLKKKWKYERPYILGKRNFLGLGTTNLKFAREERARRVALRAKGIEPTETVVIGRADASDSKEANWFENRQIRVRNEALDAGV